MEDIIVEEKKAEPIKNKKPITQMDYDDDKPKKGIGGIFVFILHWWSKALIIASLIGIDFMLFAGTENAYLFSSNSMLTTPAIYILASIIIISFVLMFVLGFSKLLQNLVVSVFAGLLPVVIITQFAQGDKYSFFSGFMGLMGMADMVDGVSHYILGFICCLAAFILLSMSNKKTLFLVSVFTVALFGTVFYGKSLDKINKKDYTVVADKAALPLAEAEKGKKFVYIMLPNLTSYSYMENVKSKTSAEGIFAKAEDIYLSFYVKNRFTLYPNAYVSTLDPFLNIAKGLNPNGDNKVADHLLQNIRVLGYFNFQNINDKTVYLKDNKLFDTFKGAKYRLTAYQSRGIDFCHKNNEINVDKCVNKTNFPINLHNLKINDFDKTSILFAQWVESMGLVNDSETVYNLFSTFAGSTAMPIYMTPYRDLYALSSVKNLDLMAEDIIKDQGNNAYFAFLDLPSDTFVYDQYCKVKNSSSWLSMEAAPFVSNKNMNNKRNAYAEQLSCLHGKLEDFMEKLHVANVLDNTVIVVQGVSGFNDLKDTKTDSFQDNLQSKYFVTMAIFDPLQNKFEVKGDICNAGDILSGYIYKKPGCEELQEFNLQEVAKDELKRSIFKDRITTEKVQKAVSIFPDWYKEWYKINAPAQPKEAAAAPKPDWSQSVENLKLDELIIEKAPEVEPIPAVDALKPDETVPLNEYQAPVEETAAVEQHPAAPAEDGVNIVVEGEGLEEIAVVEEEAPDTNIPPAGQIIEQQPVQETAPAIAEPVIEEPVVQPQEVIVHEEIIIETAVPQPEPVAETSVPPIAVEQPEPFMEQPVPATAPAYDEPAPLNGSDPFALSPDVGFVARDGTVLSPNDQVINAVEMEIKEQTEADTVYIEPEELEKEEEPALY